MLLDFWGFSHTNSWRTEFKLSLNLFCKYREVYSFHGKAVLKFRNLYTQMNYIMDDDVCEVEFTTVFYSIPSKLVKHNLDSLFEVRYE